METILDRSGSRIVIAISFSRSLAIRSSHSVESMEPVHDSIVTGSVVVVFAGFQTEVWLTAARVTTAQIRRNRGRALDSRQRELFNDIFR